MYDDKDNYAREMVTTMMIILSCQLGKAPTISSCCSCLTQPMSMIHIGDIGNDADGKGNRDDNVNGDDFWISEN